MYRKGKHLTTKGSFMDIKVEDNTLKDKTMIKVPTEKVVVKNSEPVHCDINC